MPPKRKGRAPATLLPERSRGDARGDARDSVDSVQAQITAASAPAPAETPGTDTTWTALKRQRVSRACDQCRTAREKCDGIQPCCYPCIAQSRSCTYSASPKKRGVQVGYIRTLELALAWLFDEVDGCESTLAGALAQPHEAGLFAFPSASTAASASASTPTPACGRDKDRINQLHKKWRKSTVRRSIDSLLADGEVGPRPHPTASSDHESESESAKTSAGRLPDSDTEPSPHPHYKASQAAQQPPENPRLQPPSVLHLPPNHWRLLDIYFSYTHCWFPVLEKQRVLKTVYLYGSDGVRLARSSSTAAHAELWSVLALASYQDAATQSTLPAGSTALPFVLPQIYHIARSLVPDENGPFEARHATALLLLSLINIGRGNSIAAWSFLGRARDIALETETETDSAPSLPHRHQHQHQHLPRTTAAILAGCSILETLVSLLRKQQCHTGSVALYDALHGHITLPEDELDEWQPWESCSGFGTSASPGGRCRTPAHALSTFNQLYDLFRQFQRPADSTAVSSAAARQRAATMLTPDIYHERPPLSVHDIIRPGLPFHSFVTGRGEAPADGGAPSTHILRLLFLWAEIQQSLSASEGEAVLRGRLLALLDSLQLFTTLFGVGGLPPLVTACLGHLRSHTCLQPLSSADQRRWHALERRVAAVWLEPQQQQQQHPYHHHESHLVHLDGTVKVHDRPQTALSLASPASVALSAALSAATPASFPPPAPMQRAMRVEPEPREWGDFVGSRLPENELHVAASLSGGAGGGSTSSDVGRVDMALSRQHVYGSVALDYDALLGDLTAMDYADRVDASLQPEFMANLGFAPGSDISERLLQDFDNIILP